MVGTIDRYWRKLHYYDGGPLAFTPPGAEQVTITPNFDAVVQTARRDLVFRSQDGYPLGTLVGYSVDESGVIIGEYSMV